MRIAGAEDQEEMARILLAGFTGDPMLEWIFGREDFEARALGWLRRLVPAVMANGEGCIDELGRAAAIWANPGVAVGKTREGEAQNEYLLEALGARAEVVMGAMASLSRHRPAAPSSRHLVLIGAVPGARGSGVGDEALAILLERCAEDGSGVYLNSSNPRNHSFYERRGFRRLAEARMPDGGPLISPMWRDPEALAAR